MWLGMDLKLDNTKEFCSLKKPHWTCPKYVDHSKLNSQQDWGGGLYDHLTSTQKFILTMSKTFILAPKMTRHYMAIGRIWFIILH